MTDKKSTFISSKEAATKIGVSVVTIHNWIKTGYLEISNNGMISCKNFDLFCKKHLGKTRLNSRANKLNKDHHDHELLSKKINELIIDKKFEKNLWQDYENSLSESYKNKEGIFYTPESIVSDMMKSIENIENKKFLDPCCGGGNFIMKAIELGFKPENIYGFDTDKNAVEICKQRFFNLTGTESTNIVCCDFFEEYKKCDKFDFIFTNPPWGKKIDKAQRLAYSKMVNAGKSNDTCSIFFFACLNLLNDNGKLGFLLPEAFFNISTFEDSRIAALKYNIERLSDYERPFKKLITNAEAIILKKTKFDKRCKIECSVKNNKFERSQCDFLNTPKHIINFQIKQETAKVIEYIYSRPHILLKDNATWGLGIVTGNNSKICKKHAGKNLIPIYRGKDICANGLKKPQLFINPNFENYQQVAPIALYQSPEKIVYRFISNNLVFFCDKKQNLILNSANLFVLNNNFPITYSQLTDLLNSNLINWLFKNIFNTHKILRSDLETLPIHAEYFIKNSVFEESDFLKYLNLKYDGTDYKICTRIE